MAILTSPGTLDSSSRPTSATGLIRHGLSTPLSSIYLVVASAGLILILGLIMVLSASSVYAEVRLSDSFYFAKRQFVFVVIGLLGAWLLSRLPARLLRLLGWPLLLLATAMLVLTFVPGLGVTINDNQNWVQFGSPLLRFQPSEFAKLAIVLWGADNLARKSKILGRPAELVPFLSFSSIMIGLVVLQRDLGTAIVMASMVVFILFCVGAPLRMLGLMLAGAALAAAVLVLTSENRMLRVLGFLNPADDIEGINQQPMRAIFSLASGGWWGVGLGQSKQKWGMLVEAHTDYILAIIGEELGLVGTLVLIALFTTLVATAFRIARRSDDIFYRNVATGVAVWFMIQGLLNMAVVLRLLPVVGVTLPLVSYGGSSLLANLAALGILMSAARHEPEARRVLAGKSRKRAVRVTAVVDRRS